MLIDGNKLIKMVDELCIEKRPKSKDIKDMITTCRISKNPILTAKEYISDENTETSACDPEKLDLAVKIFYTMLSEIDGITVKDFLQHYMQMYDKSEYDILADNRLID